MNPSTAIVINTPLPPAPFQLVDQTFMAALAVAEAKAAKLRVADVATANEAAALQTELTKAGTALEKERLALLRPFLDAQNAINAAAKTASARISLTKSAVNAQLVSWDTAQKKLAEEAERVRQAEIRRQAEERQKEIDRLEALRRKEMEENERQAAALLKARQEAPPPPASAAAINLDDDDVDDTPPPAVVSDTQRQLTSLRFAPITAPPLVVVPKVQGVVFRQSLRIVSTDLAQLPESFVLRQPDLVGLRQTYCTAWKEGAPMPVCPGVVFEIVKTPVSR